MFTKNFLWGVAAASYQIEGARFEDGRTPSIWDEYSHKNGAVFNGENGDVACDFYHKYKEDIALMKKFNVKAFRFSVSWSRIIPNGVGDVNEKGIEFYNNVIDELIKNDIKPCLTIFHWDLPSCLYQKGGYLNPDFPDWFSEYAKVIVERFSDRVKMFMTLNEPQCIVSGFTGEGLAPNVQYSEREAILVAHNLMLAHGKAVISMRKYGAKDIKIGFANAGEFSYPVVETNKNIEVARQKSFDNDKKDWVWSVSWFADPIILGKYPEKLFNDLKQYLPSTYESDLKIINQPLDFYGQNFYNAVPVDENGDRVKEIQGAKYTMMNWNVSPTAIRYLAIWANERYKLPVYITENGMACHDWQSLDGEVHDPQRIDYVERHLIELSKAIDLGADVRGYFYWSFSDNFEWARGYKPRFGLTFIDYQTQERIPKDSFYWYKKVIDTNGQSVFKIKNK